jgi:hypothetical protein
MEYVIHMRNLYSVFSTDTGLIGSWCESIEEAFNSYHTTDRTLASYWPSITSYNTYEDVINHITSDRSLELVSMDIQPQPYEYW